jgi:5-methylcytosine-specific restriction endonuclease McrA
VINDFAARGYKHGTRTAYSNGKCRCAACKKANAESSAAWKAKNPEKVKAATRSWHQRNPGLAAKRTRINYYSNREDRLAYQVAYRAANLDEVRARDRHYYLRNRERVIEYQREYQRVNPGSPEVRKAIKSRRRQAEGILMDALDRLLSIEYRKAIKNDMCAYCGEPGQHDDHVRPLSRGGTDHWWNLVRACAPCNFSKGSKLLEEWSGRPDLPAQNQTISI